MTHEKVNLTVPMFRLESAVNMDKTLKKVCGSDQKMNNALKPVK